MGLKYSIVKLQGAFFFKPYIPQNSLNLIDYLNKSIGSKFDGDPLILPIPSEAPPEIPRIILRNKDDALSFQLSLIRGDIVLKLPEDSTLDQSKKDFFDLVVKLFAAFIEYTKCDIIRLAYLPTLTYQTDSDASKFLLNNYCADTIKKKFSENFYAFNLHLLKRWKENDNLKLNRWIRINTKRSTDAFAPENEFHLDLDFNTWGEEKESGIFDIKAIEQFFNYTWEETLKIQKEIIP